MRSDGGGRAGPGGGAGGWQPEPCTGGVWRCLDACAAAVGQRALVKSVLFTRNVGVRFLGQVEAWVNSSHLFWKTTVQGFLASYLKNFVVELCDLTWIVLLLQKIPEFCFHRDLLECKKTICALHQVVKPR